MMRNSLPALALGAIALSLAGCGNGAASVTTSGGGANSAVAQIGPAQPGAPLPGNLPAYPNALPGADINGAAGGRQGRIVTFTTRDDPAQVLDFYTTAGQQGGLQLLQRTSAGPAATLAFLHANEAITVTATGSPAGTQVQIAAGTR